MTDRSNPITDILKRLLADVDDNMEFIGTTWNSREHASSSVSKSLDASLQALYEAVVVSSPGRTKPKTDYDKGWNDANEAWFTNLSLLFGVADVGNLDKPEATNSQPQLADNSSEVA